MICTEAAANDSARLTQDREVSMSNLQTGIVLRQVLTVALLASSLSSCGGGGGTATPAPVPTPASSPSPVPSMPTSPAPTPAPTAAGIDAKALALWQDNDETKHPKGSCSGCHGVDFFDLARIGSTRETIIRRALVDGATQAEAENLADAVALLRTQKALPQTNPRSFRPFQPGGAVLPGATGADKDIAFARQLESLLPGLSGARLGTLAAAQQAQAQLDDLISGSNTAGSNPQRLNLRTLPVGIEFPLWAADAFNANASDLAETTLNDWISDLALEPSEADRAEWLALNRRYRAEPSNANFWTLFAYTDRLVLYPEAHAASLTDAKRGTLRRYAEVKLHSTLIGRHLLVTDAAGTTAQFLGSGPVAFTYLNSNSHGVRIQDSRVLPQAAPWDIADSIGRSQLQSSINTHGTNAPVADALAELGFPAFVQDSTRVANSSASFARFPMGSELRRAWFWFGFTLDPSLQRLGRSGSTLGGEYINQTLASEQFKLFVHDAFSQSVRNIARMRAEAAFDQDLKPGMTGHATEFYLGYYLIQFHPGGNGIVKNGLLGSEHLAFYSRYVNNTHRLYLWLYLDALQRGVARKLAKAEFEEVVARMKNVFKAYEPQHQTADDALIASVRTQLGY